MPEPIPDVGQIRDSLQRLAQLLRQVRHLKADEQEELAAVMDQVASALAPGEASTADLAHLSESLGHLTTALRQPHDTGLLSAAKNRLESAAARTEADAPLAVGLIRRLLEALANLGI